MHSMLALVVVAALAGLTLGAVTITTPSSGDGAASSPLPENATVGDVVETLVATTDAVTIAGYVITSQTIPGHFAINFASGEITVAAATFDYENATEEIIVFTIADIAPSTATGTLTVSIGDVNDNTPMLPFTEMTLSIPDGTAASTVIAMVTATDDDGSAANNVVTYNLTGGSDIAVDPSTGALSVASALNASATDQYELVLRAEDSGTPTLSSTAVITVCVGTCTSSGTNTNCNTANSKMIGAGTLMMSLVMTLALGRVMFT